MYGIRDIMNTVAPLYITERVTFRPLAGTIVTKSLFMRRTIATGEQRVIGALWHLASGYCLTRQPMPMPLPVNSCSR